MSVVGTMSSEEIKGALGFAASNIVDMTFARNYGSKWLQTFISRLESVDRQRDTADVCDTRRSPQSYLPVPKGTGLASALVIDRSGSMAGEKLAKAKDGAGIYVKALSDADFASVSFFSSGASTEMPMTRYGKAVKDVDTVLSRIGATGSTNIGAGLEQGYAQLENLGVVSQSHKLALLLSDGMNNTGDWNTVVKKFKAIGWPIFTVGYGQDRDEATLRKIAEMTGGTYTHADTTNVVDAYCKIHANAKNKSGPLSVKDPLAPDGKLSYIVYVSPGAQDLMVCTSWQGSKLETVLVSPSRMILGKKRLNGRMGRYDEGKTYQLLQVNKPQAGRWQVQVRWVEPPAAAEQVNISVSEKSDLFANILGFRPEYTPGEPVTINVQVAELVGGQRVPLRSPAVRVQVQKPGGPRMAQTLQTQRLNRAMYKNVVQRNTRGLTLVDDGAHDDYHAGDGIFGGTFTETDENGAYLVFAIITGQKRTGRRIRRTLIASFQVGPIAQNPVTTAQILEVRDLLEDRTDPAEAIKALRSDPLAAIKGSQSDPLDAINKLRQGVQ